MITVESRRLRSLRTATSHVNETRFYANCAGREETTLSYDAAILE